MINNKVKVFFKKIWPRKINYSKKGSSFNIHGNRIYIYSVCAFLLLAISDLYFEEPVFINSIYIPLRQKPPDQPLSINYTDSVRKNKIQINYRHQQLNYLLSPSVLQNAGVKSAFGITYYKEQLIHDMKLKDNSSPVKIFLVKNGGLYKKDISFNLYKGKYLEILAGGGKTISEYDKLNSQNGLDFIISRNGVNEIPEQTVKAKIDDSNDMIKNLAASLSISYPFADSDRIILSIKYSDTLKAGSLLETIRSIYLNTNPDSSSLSSIKFINQKLDSLNIDLKKYPAIIETLKKERQKQSFFPVNRNPIDKATLKKQSDIYVLILTYLKIPDNQFSFVPNTFGLQDSKLELLVDKINDEQIKKQKLLQTEEPLSSSIVRKRLEILRLKNIVKTRIDSLNNAIKNALNSPKQYKKTNYNLKDNVSNNSLKTIRAEQEAKVALYFYLIQKRGSFISALASSNKLMAKYKFYKTTPVNKPIVLVLFISLLLGLLFPVPFKLIIKPVQYNLTINEILNATKVSVLGNLNFYSRNKKSISPLEYDTTIGSQLLHITKSISAVKINKVTFITSLKPGDGKSFVTRNLAIALSTLGKSVLLIQTGIIKLPDELIRMDLTKDLNSFLDTDDISINNIVYQTNFINLSIIQSGNCNPAKQIGNPRMETLIKQAKLIFDHVIIDTWASSIFDLGELVNKKNNMVISVLDVSSASVDAIESLNNLYLKSKNKNIYLITNHKK